MHVVTRSLTVALAVGLLALPGTAFGAEVPVEVTSPAPGAFVHGTVDVTASAPGADSVAFDQAGHSGGPWTAIGAPDTDPDGGFGVAWDTTTGPDGARFVRARATAGTDESVSDPVRVTVDNVTAPSISLNAAPAPFSPNHDGVRDRTFVRATLSEPARLELDVVRPGGSVLRRLARGGRFDAGTHRFEWRGLHLSGGRWRPVDDGTYTLRAVATDDAGNRGTAAVAVRVDTRPPGFVWRGLAPEPASGSGPVTLSFRAYDPAPTVLVSAELWNDVRRVAATGPVTKPRGAAAVRVSFASPPLPGLYRARVLVVDRAGNRTWSGFQPMRVQHPVTTTVVHGFTGVGRLVALTFDDCVFGDSWDAILDALVAHGVRATFFCPSVSIEHNPEQARRTVALGMAIGNHSATHPDLARMSASQIRAQLEDNVVTWWRVTRATSLPLFRPPYGAYDSTVLRVAGDLGFARTIMWDVDPSDWTDPGVRAIQQRVLSHAHPGMIVGMHVKPQTAAALPGLLSALAARGYRQVGLDEMFRVATARTHLRLGPPASAGHADGWRPAVGADPTAFGG